MTSEPTPTTDATLATPEQLTLERHRLYVLEQLGITPLVSLQDAPGAAPTRRVFAPMPTNPPIPDERRGSSALANAAATNRAISTQSRDSSGIAALRADLSQSSGSKSISAKRPMHDDTADSLALKANRSDEEPEVSFTLLIAAAGRWLWVERLATGLIRQDQLQLIQAMGRVIEGAKTGIRHVQFDWPLVDHSQLPKDLNSARQSVAGQLQRLAREATAVGIVIMGEQTSELISEAINLTRIMIPATVDMLETPALKGKAWQVLRPHVSAH